MPRSRSIKLLVTIALFAAAVIAIGPSARAAAADLARSSLARSLADVSPNVTVFSTGLNNPRGLKFGPDGSLYVAEGGTGGTNSTAGQCDQVPDAGPYTGSKTGARISKISPTGEKTTVVDNLPSSQTNPQLGGLVSGASDVAFVGNTLYILLSGAGCSHGVSEMPNAVLRANPDGATSTVVDLSAYLKANPVKNPSKEDFEPDGTWYSLIAVGNDLYALEPNHGELDKITTDGKITRVVDISDSQGHIVPTAMAMGTDGNFYVGNLGTFPAAAKSKILKITPAGQIGVFAQGLTAVVGVAFDSKGTLYALETSAPSTSPDAPIVPGTGRMVRVSSTGTLEPVATGLTFPSAMTFGPDGRLYVSNFGFGFPAGKGEIDGVDVSMPLPALAPGATSPAGTSTP